MKSSSVLRKLSSVLLQILRRIRAVSVSATGRQHGATKASFLCYSKKCLTTNTTQHIIWHGVLHHVLCGFFFKRLHRNRIMVSNRPERASGGGGGGGTRLRVSRRVHSDVAAVWHACGGGVSEDLQLLCNCEQALLVSVLHEFQSWSASALFFFFCKPRRGGWTGFSLHCGGELFFFFFFFPLSWRESYVRGESLPTAPLCFCFSQWANVSLPRPHSLSSRPLSWKHSLAEATQGQACEVGGWGSEGGGALPANHMIVDPTVPALHEAQMLRAHFNS